MAKLTEARAIIDYAQEDSAKDFRDAFYSALQDKVLAHIESHKQELARTLVTQEEAEKDEDEESSEHSDEKQDKAMLKKMVKKSALKEDESEEYEEDDTTHEEIEEARQVHKLSPRFADKEREARALAMLMGKMKKKPASSVSATTTHAGTRYAGSAQTPDPEEQDDDAMTTKKTRKTRIAGLSGKGSKLMQK